MFSALSKGQPVLAIVDTDSGRREAEHEFPQLGRDLQPGLVAGRPTDRLLGADRRRCSTCTCSIWRRRTLTQLTDDPFADLDPEWSPDGRELAWVTDRFSSDVEGLALGNYRIGAIDVRTRAARQLAGFETGRNINPEFSADGRSLFFIATPDGIPNIYRQELGGGTVLRVTNVLSGVAGITPLTPALSVAAAAPGLVFSVYEADNYNLYSATTPQQLAGAVAPAAERDAAVLPPSTRERSEVAQLLESPAAGLPRPQQYDVKPYSAGLSLDAIGQPTVGVGADRFGAYAAGGISAIFSDILGNHQVGATVQLTSRFQEIGGAVSYINRKSRWNWGVVGEQTPYVTGAFGQSLIDLGGNRQSPKRPTG